MAHLRRSVSLSALLFALLAACGSTGDDSPDAGKVVDAGDSSDAGETQDAGDEEQDAGTLPDPTLTAIEPATGQAGDAFVLRGTRLGSITSVRFGVASTSVTVAADGLSVSGLVPERHADDALTVDVKAIGAGFELTLADAFTFGAPVPPVEWCTLLAPLSTSVRVGETTETLAAKAYHPDVTAGEGAGAGLRAQVGWGAGSDPAAWAWADATFARQDGNDDVFESTVTPDVVGEQRFAFRFALENGPWRLCDSDGDAFDVANAGTLTVEANPAIDRVEPASARAGDTVQVFGEAFEEGAVFRFGTALATDVTVTSATQASMKVPTGLGTVAVSVEIDGVVGSKDAAFTYVVEQDELVVTGFAPAFLPLEGGALTIEGANFTASTTVKVGSVDATITTQESGKLVIAVPALPAGEHTVEVSDAATVEAEHLLVVVPRLTITPDGDLSDWPAGARLGTDAAATEWAGNELRALYAGYDDTALYLGIEGKAGADNVIVGYLGFDHVEWGSGRIDLLSDGSGALDDALTSLFQVPAPEFRAQYGFGLFGHAPALESSDGAGVADGMGVRRLEDGSNFAWVRSTVKRCAVASGGDCSEPTGAVEFAIPWRQATGGDTDAFVEKPTSATLRVFVRIVNASGQFTPNQSLPSDPNAGSTDRAQVSRLAAVPIR